MQFNRLHHQKISHVLSSLDKKKLLDSSCYFGGGTAIALRYGEYRESVDIDFMVSDINGYRFLRNESTNPGGISNLFSFTHMIDTSADVRADQYGIRTFLRVMETSIKFEIVLEGRIKFGVPEYSDDLPGVPCLNSIDLIASKLLANSDRWGDVSVYSRDLIDLAMMTCDKGDWGQALLKASSAYGEAIKNDLFKAIAMFLQQPMYVQRCCKNLKIGIAPSGLIDRVRRLEKYVV
jgi:hypothetical protein